MRIALIKNGTVINVIEGELGTNSSFTEIESDVAGVGDAWDGETFTPLIGLPAQPIEVQPIKILEVSCFQAKVALDQSGLLDVVQALMDAPETPNKIKLAWNNGATFKRYSDMILSMAAVLNLSDEQLDDLFSLAATIE
jgi:hypothetical protein